MRRINFGVMAVSAAILMLFASCSDVSKTSLKTDRAELSDEVELTSGRKDMFNYDYKIEHPVSGASEEVIAKYDATILEATIGSDYMTYPISKALSMYRDARVSDYREENLDLLDQLSNMEVLEDDDDLRSEVDLSWDEKIEGFFAGEYRGIVSYVVYTYNYEGGAHGNESELSINFDAATGDVVEEEDFFLPGYETRLGSLLTMHLESSFTNPEDYDMLFMKEIQPNGNFRVSPLGVTYTYTPYEIGPYSLGTINVTVSWEEVEDILRDNIGD